MKVRYPIGWFDNKKVKSEDESFHETAWTEEHERVPLKQRLKMLRNEAAVQNRKEIPVSDVSPAGEVVNKEGVLCESLEFYANQDEGEGRSSSASCVQRQHGNANARDDSVTRFPSWKRSSSSDDIEIIEDFDEDLDHVSLKERRKMLLSRELARSVKPTMEYNSPDPSTNPVGRILQNSRSASDICGMRSTIGKNVIFEKGTFQPEGATVTKPQTFKNVRKEARPCSSSRSDISTKRLLSSSCKDVRTLPLKPLPNVKIEPLDGDLEYPNRSIGSQISIKGETVNSSENLQDIIDHMMLGDRMRLLVSSQFPKTNVYEQFPKTNVYEQFPKTNVYEDEDYEAGNDHKSKLSSSSKPLAIKRPRKRRRTATDSIETALEEDAPGLLQVLIQKGVLVDEIKLYGANEDDEPLDESLVDESFSDLEEVITKLFSQQQSLFKFAPIRCGRGDKTSYCLACLISLVEQARYLRVRKWPVEWGWCRDLQSFIFVFNKHNRIVLERPEYGYATYFFELVDALPVHWQIKRLVTAMKLTSFTRMTLIENRALTVGDDLTEGEARVLMEYGWIPNTGLGTMLNYCDRVVHDRKNDSESDNSSEWRSKIGKLLTDGYNGGIIVPNDIPKKVMEYGLGHTPDIKLEY